MERELKDCKQHHMLHSLSNCISNCLKLLWTPHGFLGTEQSLLVFGVGHTNIPMQRFECALEFINSLHVIANNDLALWSQKTINFRNESIKVAPEKETKTELGNAQERNP